MELQRIDRQFIFPIFINHRKYEGLRDTSCEVILLKYEHFIDKVSILAGERLTIEGVGGQPTTLPVAIVQLHSPCIGQSEPVWVKAGLVRNFISLDQLQDIVSCIGNRNSSTEREIDENSPQSLPTVLAVVTRSRRPTAAIQAHSEHPLGVVVMDYTTPPSDAAADASVGTLYRDGLLCTDVMIDKSVSVGEYVDVLSIGPPADGNRQHDADHETSTVMTGC